MIGALLKQILITYYQHLPVNIINSLAARREQGKSLSLENAFRFLKSALLSFERSYICIDAVDECNDNQRKSLLRPFNDFLDDAMQSIRIFVTGRTYMEKTVKELFEVSPYTVTLQANADDIRAYVACQVKMDDNYDEMDECFKKEITDIIVSTANGMLVRQPILTQLKRRIDQAINMCLVNI
jgi:hypothetical protein